MSEQERYSIRQAYGDAKEIGIIMVTGFVEACAETTGDAIIKLAQIVDDNLFDFPDDK